MPANGPEPTSGRETRLLVLVIVVSLAVLLLLARFQFPGASISTVTPSPGPLAGMAARATFEEMASALSGILPRAGSAVGIVRLEPIPADAPDQGGPGGGEPSAAGATRGRQERVPGGRQAAAAAEAVPPAVAPRFMPSLRVRPDLALLHVPAGWRPAGILEEPNPVEVVWSDTDRELAAIRLSVVPGSLPGLPPSAPGVTGFMYVGVLQGTRSGPTVQPAFIGRTDTETDARWSTPLIVLSGPPDLPMGSLVYALDGRLVGLVLRHDAGRAVVPVAALDDAAARLASPGAANE